MSLVARVEAGAEALDVALPPGAAERLVALAELLARWNARIRLVGPADVVAIIDAHIVDALGFVRTLQRLDGAAPTAAPDAWYDVGSGGGLPGLPLAIAFPERRFELVEPVAKKSAFQTRAAVALGLDRVVVHAARDDQLPPDGPRAAMSRATFAPEVWYERASSLVGPGGLVLVALGRTDAPALREAAMVVDDYKLPRDGARRTNLVLKAPR